MSQKVSGKEYLDTYLKEIPRFLGSYFFCDSISCTLNYRDQTDRQADRHTYVGPTSGVILLKKRWDLWPAPGPSPRAWILDDAKTLGMVAFKQAEKFDCENFQFSSRLSNQEDGDDDDSEISNASVADDAAFE